MKKNIFMLIIIMTILFAFYTLGFADDFAKMDQAGNKILAISRKVAYWIILIKSIQDVMRCAMAGDNNGIGGIIMKYIMMYGALFMLPWLLRLVEGIF